MLAFNHNLAVNFVVIPAVVIVFVVVVVVVVVVIFDFAIFVLFDTNLRTII